jgi:hypothetical protein
LAEAEAEGLKKAGITADIYQIAETLSEEVLTKVSNRRSVNHRSIEVFPKTNIH